MTTKEEIQNYEKFQKDNGYFFVGNFWFDRVHEAHKLIREKLGGTAYTRKIELKDLERAVPIDQLMPWMHKLIVEIPEYFANNFPYSLEALCRSKLADQKSKVDGIKWGKHIVHYLEKQKMEDRIPKVNSILGEFGQLWSRHNTTCETLEVSITTEPSAFYQIGHYGCDQQSCFKQGGCNQNNKYILGMNPNTFVVLVTKPDQKDKLARMWGTASPTMDMIHVHNFYATKTYAEANLLTAIDETIRLVFGFGEKDRCEKNVKLANVYQNDYINWTYTKNHEYFNTKQTVLIDTFDIASWWTCRKCKKLQLPPAKDLCPSCAENKSLCEYTGQYFDGKPIEAFYGSSYKKINIDPSLVISGLFFKDIVDGQYYHQDLCYGSPNGPIAYRNLAHPDSPVVMCEHCATYVLKGEKCGCRKLRKQYETEVPLYPSKKTKSRYQTSSIEFDDDYSF